MCRKITPFPCIAHVIRRMLGGCKRIPYERLRTRNSRKDSRTIFKLGGWVDHVTTDPPLTKVKRSKGLGHNVT